MYLIRSEVITEAEFPSSYVFRVLIYPSWLHSLPVWTLILYIFHNRQKSRHYLPLSFIKVSFAYVFKGIWGYFSTAVFYREQLYLHQSSCVAFWLRTVQKRKLVTVYMVPNLGGTEYDLYWVVRALTLTSLEMECNWKFQMTFFCSTMKQAAKPGHLGSKMTKSRNRSNLWCLWHSSLSKTPHPEQVIKLFLNARWINLVYLCILESKTQNFHRTGSSDAAK